MMNKTAAFQGTDNYKQIREEFVEKNGLSRSLHPALLAGDDEIQKCYRKACKNGELPVYQVKVHFVGDPYAGKTSTRRHLMGESFCEELARTEGIETNNVETCYADEDWNPITSMDADSGVSIYYGMVFGRFFFTYYGGSYWLRKLQGFMIGVVFLHFVGWDCGVSDISPRNWTIRLLWCTILVITEIVRYVEVKNSDLPIISELIESFKFLERRGNKSKREIIKQVKNKFILMDYAGNQLYHSIHHVFMSDHSIYLVVFNLQELSESLGNKEKEHVFLQKKLQFWLQSVCSHGNVLNTKLFLVGTRRNEVTDEKILEIEEWLCERLTYDYGDHINVNRGSTRKPSSIFYAIENSASLQSDNEAKKLMQDVRIAQTDHVFKQSFPIKWTKFKSEFESYNKKIFLVDIMELKLKYENHFNQLGENLENERKSDENFLKMLQFFDKNGEIMLDEYNGPTFAVLEPSFLVEILKFIAKITQVSDFQKEIKKITQIDKKLNMRPWVKIYIYIQSYVHYFLQYLCISNSLLHSPINIKVTLTEEKMLKRGIIYGKVLKDILKFLGLNSEESIDSLIRIMQTHNLICSIGKKIRPCNQYREEDDIYLLPFALRSSKKENRDSILHSIKSNNFIRVVHFRFLKNSPVKMLFLRLLVTCADLSKELYSFQKENDKCFDIPIYCDMGCFQSDQITYKIECKEETPENIGPKPVIELCIGAESESNIHSMVKRIYEFISQIRDKSFKLLKFEIIMDSNKTGINERSLINSLAGMENSENGKPESDHVELGAMGNMGLSESSELQLSKPEIRKQRIKKNFHTFIQDMDYRGILPYLYQDDVLNTTTYEDLQASSKPISEKKAEVLQIVMSQGTQGLISLSNAFREVNQLHLANIIDHKEE